MSGCSLTRLRNICDDLLTTELVSLLEKEEGKSDVSTNLLSMKTVVIFWASLETNMTCCIRKTEYIDHFM